GINNAGQVVGFGRFSPDAPYMGFRTAPNSPIQSGDLLGALGGTSSVGNGINQSGQAVGGAYLVGDNVQHAFRTVPNAPINPATDDLGVLGVGAAGGEFSEARTINSSGQVAGSSSVVDGVHAFRSTPNGQPVVLTDLGTLGGLFSEAFGINDSGVVVGRSATFDLGWLRAFRTAPNSVII